MYRLERLEVTIDFGAWKVTDTLWNSVLTRKPTSWSTKSFVA